MVMVAFLLVVLPVVQDALPSLLAFGAILLGVPVYIFLVMETPWKLRPRVIDRISSTQYNVLTIADQGHIHSQAVVAILWKEYVGQTNDLYFGTCEAPAQSTVLLATYKVMR